MRVIDTIEGCTFEQSEFIRGNKAWKAETLYLFAKAKEYPVRDLPLWAVDLSDEPFDARSLALFIMQAKRVQQCSLEHPIILDDAGQIADGYHRLCKAILEGHETIKAIRLEEMPAPDRIVED
jgi:hypothetical protein